ncbi:hypothetical protein [Silanimonas sp.]|uniref:hypothetical protein n=1 Tax=Silanimonas sp. TaxID=1929290 RepID=UPI0022BE795E|nr:hypothetical protein [Silanimonas sp.]MCZ8165980.1 hypothetical protein [Silanimonas sp.]
MKAGHRITLAAVLLGAAAGGAWWWMVRSSTPTHIEQADGSLPPAAETVAPATMVGTAEYPVPALSIGEYRADTSGLPPIDAPLAAQIPALRDAAARGNATAACRLAVIGSQCIRARALSVSLTPERSAAMERQAEDNLREQYAQLSLEGLPEPYRAYAQRRLDTEALQEMDRFQSLNAWGRRCADIPPISHDEILASLRQAALAGEPESMVSYASGFWMGDFSIFNLVSGFGGSGPGGGWLRSPGFDQWRREAAAVRRAALERGDPEMLWFEFAFSDRAGLRLIEPADPIDSAAALRAYAAVIGGHAPESTAALGLPLEQAAEADRRSDAWAARARERGRRAEDVTDGMLTGRELACD